MCSRCSGLWAAAFSLAAAAHAGPLVFLADRDYPPMAYLEGGWAKGMDVELGRALAKRMKRDIQIDLVDWNLAQERVLKGEADGLLGMSISEERRKLFDFAIPMFTREFGLLVRDGEMRIHGARDLRSRRVGVTPGGFPRRFMEARSGVEVVLINNYEEGIERLTNGNIDAIAADLWVAAYTMDKGGVRGVRFAGKPFATAPAAIAVKKGNSALLEDVNRAIRTMKSDGSIERIRDKWRPQEMLFVSRGRVRGLVMMVGGGVLLALFGTMGLWIFTLKKQIRIRKQTEAALRESEERLRAVIEKTPNVAIQLYDSTGRVLLWNHASQSLYGWSAAEAVGKTLDQLIHTKEEAAQFVAQLKEIETSGRPQGPAEIHVRRRDGSEGYCLATLFSIPASGVGPLFVCMDVDLSDLKKADAALRESETQRAGAMRREQQALETYTRQLIASQESERRRIAGELHDTLGQNLLLVKSRAQMAMASGEISGDVRDQLDGIHAMAAEAIAEVRQIAQALHPYQLDHLGLTRAIEAMIESAAQSTDVAFERKLDPVDDIFSPESAANLYRVAQECLNNVLKHAKARAVWIELDRDVRHVRLSVRDNGCGFQRDPAGASSGGLGLKSIAERVRILGGSLDIKSAPGAGTTIEVVVPMPGEL